MADDADVRFVTGQPSGVAAGLVRLMQSMEAVYTRETRKDGLTAQQTQLLCTAARRQAGLGEMAETLHCDRSNVSRLLDRVATRGLAYRAGAASDGRVAMVRLSDDGHEVVERFQARLESRLDRLVADWSPARRKSAARLLAALVDAIDDDLRSDV